MRHAILILAVATTGCVGDGAPWPSLARRPIEGPLAGRPAAAAASPVAVAAPADLLAIGEAGARLSRLERDLTDIDKRFTAQRTATAAAVSAAKGAKTDSDAWSKAELEKTRLDRIGTDLDDLRDRLDVVTAALAAGGDTTAAQRTTGAALTARADALADAYAAASR